MDLKGKKLLVLGGVAMICELVQNAQRRGAYVIVADYYSDSAAKRFADEAWLVSTADTEKLSELCLKAHVDGVISAFDDFNIFCAQRLSERIGAPFYATGEQLENTMDKTKFKELCRKNGVPSTPEFYLDRELSRSALDAIRYPVIMKPADSSGARGITICNTEEELRTAYETAMRTSKRGKVILEKYMVGDEIGVNYILQDGEIHASVLHDRYMQNNNGQHVRLPVAYVYPSKYTKHYLEQEDSLVANMFRSLGMRNGSLFLQGCVDDATCYFYEMGYRLNGAKQYQLLDALCGFNPMEMIVNYSLTGKEADESITPRINPMLGKACCTLSILAKPAKIAKIIGLEEIRSYPETVAVTQWYQEGEEITPDAIGTQKQICMRITLATESMQSLADTIRKVYRTLDVMDEEGKSILLEQFDPNRILEGLTEE